VAPLVKVLTANVYVGNQSDQKCANRIKDLQPHVAMLQEAQNTLGVLEDTLPGYRFHYGKQSDAARGIPVLAQESMDSSSGYGNLFGCPEVEGKQCGKARWMTYQVTRLPGSSDRRAVIGTHFNCSVQNDDGTPKQSRLLDNYIRHSETLQALIAAFQEIGWSPIVAGDFNYRLKGKVDTPDEAPAWSPYGIARTYGLRYEAQGIDGVMWHPKRYSMDKRQCIPKAETGSDHDWLMVYLRAK
jgi:endonuclease/exonuclease/phosphatase family metal-dependent hydrolase